MKKGELKKMNMVFVMMPIFIACFLLLVAAIWGNRGDWVRAGFLAIMGIIVSMGFPAGLLCRKIDERFERLEKILDKKNQSEKELKIIEQEHRKSPQEN